MDNAHSGRVWWFAFGYFATYVPYAALTKAVTSGEVTGAPWSGTALLPIATATSAISMFVVISMLGWWRYAPSFKVGGLTLPRPRAVTAASGLATSAIVLTTTLAYAFDGVSILFAMLLMRGGVLLLAPIVDQLTGRHWRTIPWWSWAGSGLSLVALVVAFAEVGVANLSLGAAIDIGIYLAAYFFRLRWMSIHAKAAGPDARARRIAFFVEEQMVATPAALVGLAIVAVVWPVGRFADALRLGFEAPFAHPELLVAIVAIGLCSQGTGTFGALVLLEPQENAYTVPVNRASSVLAGVFASVALTLVFGNPLPSGYELVGSGIILAAIAVLAWPVSRQVTPSDRSRPQGPASGP